MCLNEQDSEYALGPKYSKILNMAGFLVSEPYNVRNMLEYALAEF